MLAFHKAAIRMHRINPVLKTGSLQFLLTDYNCLGYARFTRSEQIIVLFNNNDEERELKVPVWMAGIGREGRLERIFYSEKNGFSVDGSRRDWENQDAFWMPEDVMSGTYTWLSGNDAGELAPETSENGIWTEESTRTDGNWIGHRAGEQAGWLHSPGCENELSAWAVPAETEKLRRKVYCKVESGTIHVKLPGTAAAVYRRVSSSEEMRG